MNLCSSGPLSAYIAQSQALVLTRLNPYAISKGVESSLIEWKPNPSKWTKKWTELKKYPVLLEFTQSQVSFHMTIHAFSRCFYQKQLTTELGMGDMGFHGICCDNDINDDNSGNPVSLEKSIIFPIFTPNRVLWALPSAHVMQWLFNSYWKPEGALAQKLHIAEVILLTTLHEGIQLSLNKMHNGDKRNFNWWNLKTINIRLHKMYGLSVFFNLGYFYKECIFIMQC